MAPETQQVSDSISQSVVCHVDHQSIMSHKICAQNWSGDVGDDENPTKYAA